MVNDSLPEIPVINKGYLIDVYVFTIALPFAAVGIEAIGNRGRISTTVIAKWFLFFAVGIRLSLVGIRQMATKKLVKEPGFGNLSLGAMAVISLFIPSWRMVAAFGSSFYYGTSALVHFLQRPTTSDETFILLSNGCIFLVLILLLIGMA
jgi:hypothetical protein